MDNGRHPSEGDPIHGELEQPSGETPAPDADPASQNDSLTHRPRAQAKLSRETLASLRPSVKAHKASQVTELRPRRNLTDRGTATRLDLGSDLRPLADQLVAIAEQLRSGDLISAVGPAANRIAVSETPAPQTGPSEPARNAFLHSLEDNATSLDENRKTFADMARATYAKRRKRSAIFEDPDLFGEPGWDILLDLYIAQVENKSVSVSSACIGSAAPPTTGLRWLGVLAEQGLVLREHDPQDQRRVMVRLTDKAMEAMDTYFASSASTQGDRRAARA